MYAFMGANQRKVEKSCWAFFKKRSNLITNFRLFFIVFFLIYKFYVWQISSLPVNMHISDQYRLRAVLYCVYRCCLANIETTLGLFYKTHLSEIRKILLNCFISQFNFIRHSYLQVLISVLSKDKCYYTILRKKCSILSKQSRITNTEQH